MARGKFFRRFSLQALGKRWMKRFGYSARKRFLRQQDVHRQHMRMERLEERSLLTTYTWVGGDSAAPAAWSDANNWSPATVPTSADDVVFDGTATSPNSTVDTGFAGTVHQ